MNNTDKRNALSLYRMDADSDAWGSVMIHAFGISDTLYALTGDVPSEWQYSPGMGSPTNKLEDWPASEYAQDLEDSTLSEDQLVYAGSVLLRYAKLLDKHGLSY